MVATMIRFMFVLGLLLSSWVQAAEFTASVNRTQVNEQDSFILTLRLNEQAFRNPDLSALNKDFRILGQTRAQQMSFDNGQMTSYTEWNITLMPLKIGQFVIPALSQSGAQTQPIQIEVLPLSQAIRAQTEKDFFFDVQLEPKTALYVQEQLLYVEKLYYAENNQNAQITPLEVADARVQQIGEIQNYTTVVNGRRFGVYERRFLIFPEVAGELVIPGQRFTATVPNPYDRWSRGREVKAISQPIRLNVAGIPADYPKNAQWLPSSQLSLTESFSQDPSIWQLGDAVTRTLSIKAQGVQGNQLPEIKLPTLDGVRYYPDQSKQEDRVTEQGLTGLSVQAAALVATSGGTLVLPEIRLPWWNTQTQQLEYAVLPAHQIHIKGATATTQPAAPAPAIEPLAPTAATTNSGTQSSFNLLWLAVLAALLLVSVILNLVLFLRRPKASSAADTTGDDRAELWQGFVQACNSNQAPAIRASLIAYAQSGALPWLRLPVHSLHDLARQSPDLALSQALSKLDVQLFGARSKEPVQGRTLKTLIEKSKKSAPRTEAEELYPR